MKKILSSILVVTVLLSFVACAPYEKQQTNLKGDVKEMKKALVVIDVQKDYMDQGKFPLWNTENTVNTVVSAIEKAKAADIPVILVQHEVEGDPKTGVFIKDTEGVQIVDSILAAAPNAPVVKKAFADSFYETDLEHLLSQLGVTDLILCGMMTQNCVTHTAMTKSVSKYNVKVLSDATTTVNDALHYIALEALSTSVELVDINSAF